MGLAKELDFGLPFFYRVLLPGALLAGLGNPLVAPYLSLAGVTGPDIVAWVGLVAAVVIGILLSAIDDPIYQLYEGRRWPRAIAAWRTQHLAATRRGTAHADGGRESPRRHRCVQRDLVRAARVP